MIVNGKEYKTIAIVQPTLYPKAFANKSKEFLLEGKRKAIYVLTQWNNGVWSLRDANCRYVDNVSVEEL